MATLETEYNFGDKVHIDGCKSIEAVVTAFVWRNMQHEVEVSWFDNGRLQSEWLGGGGCVW